MAPIVKILPSYIKDSQHALEILRNFSFLGQNKLIFTMDITSLYTVTPNDECLRALKHFFDHRTVKEPSSETLHRLTEQLLTLNCSFGGNYNKQTNSVAMGTKMEPSYANLFVGFIAHQYHGPKPELYDRYIDDCIGATSSTREEHTQFITAVNSFHPALQYTREISDTSLAFLDLKISIESNGLCTSVYYKPTDSHSYLLFSPSHSSYVKNSIPFSQFLRLRLCSDDSDFSQKSEALCQFFCKRGYPISVVQAGHHLAQQIDRQSALQTDEKENTDRIPFTLANVIYCITCAYCNKVYIGEAGRRLGDRFREHLRDVERNDKDASKPVARHFNLPNHSKQLMAVCGLSLHLGSSESRKTLEQKFIFQIGTLDPHGIKRALFIQLI